MGLAVSFYVMHTYFDVYYDVFWRSAIREWMFFVIMQYVELRLSCYQM